MNKSRRFFVQSTSAVLLATAGQWAQAGAYTDFFRAVKIDDAGAVRSLLA